MRAARGDEFPGILVRTRAFGGDVTWKNNGTRRESRIGSAWSPTIRLRPKQLRDGQVQYIINGETTAR